jgi:hypothetical protein
LVFGWLDWGSNDAVAFQKGASLSLRGRPCVVVSGSGVSLSLIGASVLGLVVPGMVAAFCTRSVIDHVAAAKRDIFATSLSALVVIVLVNYLIVGSLPDLADVPQLFGL